MLSKKVKTSSLIKSITTKKKMSKGSIFITVLVSNSTEDGRTNEKLIADIAKRVWDYYSK